MAGLKNVVCKYRQWNLIQSQKEVNPTIGYNMDKSGVHYTKLDNPDKVKYV